MLVNVGKCSKMMSSSSWLGTLTGAADGVCALGIESSPYMVIVSPNPWKGMLSMFYVLGVGGDGEIGIGEALTASLEDKPFSFVLCFFDKDPTSMTSLNHFCCRSRNPTYRLTTISFSSASSIIGGTTSSIVSYHLVYSTSNISFGLVTVSWTWGWTIVFFF